MNFQHWYDAHVSGPLAQASPAVREQIAVAIDAAPSAPGEVDAWYEAHLQKPPLSQYPALSKAMREAKRALKTALKDPVKKPADTPADKPADMLAGAALQDS